MARELKGRVKESIWTKPICTDESDPLSVRRLARKDFKHDRRGEEEPADVVAPEVFDDAFDLPDFYSN